MIDTEQIVLTTDSTSAGSLLRQARINKGMHIATLASSIKVPQRKLELLESDQWDQLPDMAFARALAQTVCRTLKVDTAAVMALLPTARAHRIEQLGEGLNAPFRERAGQADPPTWAWLRHPAVVAACLMLLAAVALYMTPPHWLSLPAWLVNSESALQGSGPTSDAPSLVTETLPATLPGAIPDIERLVSTPLTTQSTLPDPNTPLELRVTAPSWVEVTDGRGKTVFGQMVQPNEPVFLGGTLPLRVKIGNVAVTEVRFRGQRIDLTTSTRENVARIELN